MPFAAANSLIESGLLQDVTTLTKALADEHRLRILNLLLQTPELCACQIIEVFDLANSTISKHLAILRQAGLIQSRKEGRWVYYFLPASPVPGIQATLDWLSGLLRHDPTLQADLSNIQNILKLDPVELCRRQNGRDCCP